MSVRVKKFIGVFLIIILVVVYADIAVTIASAYLGEAAWYVHLLYFLLTGLLWVVPAMWLIKWMASSKPSKDSQ